MRLYRNREYRPVLPTYPKHIVGGGIPLNVWFGMYCFRLRIQKEAMAALYPKVKLQDAVFKWEWDSTR